MIKNAILFLLFIMAGVALLAIYLERNINTANTYNQSPISPLPMASSYSIDIAPSDSLRGQIIKMTGDVSWQSRTATEASKINEPQTLQQGESISTGDTGTATIQFASASAIIVEPQTSIDFIQTLPTSNVFAQSNGTATYTKFGTIPLAIRSHTLLVQITSGTVSITVSKILPYITVSSTDGSAIAAYNDSDFVSHEQEVDSNQEFIFNDSTQDGYIR